MTLIKHTISSFILLMIISLNLLAQKNEDSLSLQLAKSWADSVMTEMSIEQKAAQCIFLRVYSNKKESDYKEIDFIINKYGIGGLVFFQGNPYQQGILTKRWQEISKIPLFISMDAETGLGWRLKGTFSYPNQMTLGALQDNSYIKRMGKQIGRKLRALGVQINFAPVADVNNNENNPVINARSFGDNPRRVSEKCIAFVDGLETCNIMPVAKHFPGHGDTDSDSHYSLPVIKHNRQRLDSIELLPFRELIDHRIEAIMTGHLYVPELQDSLKLPSSMSEKIVKQLLQEELGFQGLIITDGLDMAGASAQLRPGQAALNALMAGNDILLIPENIPASIKAIKKSIQKGNYSETELNQHCQKILVHKYLHGLNKKNLPDLKDIKPVLNTAEDRLLRSQIFENAISLLKNENETIPFTKDEAETHLAVLNIDERRKNYFNNEFTKYQKADFYTFNSKKTTLQDKTQLLRDLKSYDFVVVNFLNTDNRPSENFGISEESIRLVNQLQLQNKLILNFFTSPYALRFFKNEVNIEAICVSYQYLADAQKASAKILCGELAAKGKLPVAANEKYPSGSGIETLIERPLEVGSAAHELIDPNDLKPIDTIIQNGLDSMAYPGGQVLIARNGKIIYDCSFGYLSNDSLQKTNSANIYDLASLTKILATTLAVMKLQEDSVININKPISDYLPFLKGSNKEGISIKKIMAHQARLEPWIPFYLETITEEGRPDSLLYRSQKQDLYEIRVADSLYLLNSYRDTVFQRIFDSELLEKDEYKYSDLGFYLLKEAIEKIINQKFELWIDSVFYRPMGLNSLSFLPRERFPRELIAPTENDTFFRFQLIRGDVHDYGAAMLGGVCGHAGLFGNAYDVAALMQMLLQGGIYNGKKYLNPETIEQFTQYQFPEKDNRRGLGFDKPPLENDGLGPVCLSAPPESFGHSGFTGTYTWADPKNNLVYVFICNRINPSASNRVLIENNIRTRIQQVIYNAIEKGEKKY